MKNTQRKYLNKLFNFALTNNSDDFHIFFNFSGHVEKIGIDVHLGGWEEDSKPDYSNYFYLDGEEDVENKPILQELIELKRKNEKR